jgi:hypothetical protein
VSEAFLLLGVSKVDVLGVPSGSEIDPTVISHEGDYSLIALRTTNERPTRVRELSLANNDGHLGP